MSQASRRIRVGSIVWMLSIQYFIIEWAAQRAWGPVPYTLRFNTISDLGATGCGIIPVIMTFACSPLHALMNLSFILSGVLTIAGMYILRPIFTRRLLPMLGMGSIMLGSLGAIGVGLFP